MKGGFWLKINEFPYFARPFPWLPDFFLTSWQPLQCVSHCETVSTTLFALQEKQTHPNQVKHLEKHCHELWFT